MNPFNLVIMFLLVGLVALSVYLAVQNSKKSHDCAKCPNDCAKCPKTFNEYRIKSKKTGNYLAADLTMTSDASKGQIVAVGRANRQDFMVPSFGVQENMYNLAYNSDSTDAFGVVNIEGQGLYFLNVSGDVATGVVSSSQQAMVNPDFQVVLEPVA